MVDPAVLSAAAAAAGSVLTAGVATLHARSKSAPEPTEPGDPAPLEAALETIINEPVPVLASHDLTNVHIPGSYADRVRSIAATALEAHRG